MKKEWFIVSAAGLSALVATATVQAVPIVALNTNNQLTIFDSATPGVSTLPVAITGIQAGETIVGIDFRPRTGELRGVGLLNGIGTVYTINPSTGGATSVLSGFALNGTSFGVDFNPVPDALRIVSNTGQNLRITAGGAGVVNTDGTINPAGASVAGSAYSNNINGATTTTLYGIDFGTDQLFIQTPPNNGTLVLVGPLLVDTTELLGFDIAPGPLPQTAFASLTAPNASVSSLYTIDLATGNATLVGTIAGGQPIRGIAVALVIPEPATLALTALAALALGMRPRHRGV